MWRRSSYMILYRPNQLSSWLSHSRRELSPLGCPCAVLVGSDAGKMRRNALQERELDWSRAFFKELLNDGCVRANG